MNIVEQRDRLAKEVKSLQKEIQRLRQEIASKPEKIESAKILSTLIDKYDITASQDADIAHRVEIGELKTFQQIDQVLASKKIFMKDHKESN